MDLAAGIDLSGRTTGTTAIAWLEGGSDRPRLVGSPPGPRFAGIAATRRSSRACVRGDPQLVAIDAPLTLAARRRLHRPRVPRLLRGRAASRR